MRALLRFSLFLIPLALSGCAIYRHDPLTGARSPNGKLDAVVTADVRFGKTCKTYVSIDSVGEKWHSHGLIVYVEEGEHPYSVKWVGDDTLQVQGAGQGKVLSRISRIKNIVIVYE
jgi:hypothetical protein